jgi:hypothetical protein
LKATASKKLNIIKTIGHFKWEADLKTLQIHHNSPIQSKLDYGSHIYSLANYNILKTFNTIQNSSVQLIVCCAKSTAYHWTSDKSISSQNMQPNDVYTSNTHNRDYFKTLLWPPPENLLYKAPWYSRKIIL